MLHGRFPILGGSSLNAVTMFVCAILLIGPASAAADDGLSRMGAAEPSLGNGFVPPALGEVARVVRDVGGRLRDKEVKKTRKKVTTVRGALSGAARRHSAGRVRRLRPSLPPCVRSVVVVSSDVRRANQWFPVSRSDEVACLLRQGDAGAEVRTLQQSLNSCYDARLVEDGIFGPRTRRALGGVQRRLGLPVTGAYGPGTRQAIYRDGGFAWRRWDGAQSLCLRQVPDGGSRTGRFVRALPAGSRR